MGNVLPSEPLFVVLKGVFADSPCCVVIHLVRTHVLVRSLNLARRIAYGSQGISHPPFRMTEWGGSRLVVNAMMSSAETFRRS